ncbi:hypothetical protein, partial [Microcoleus sp. BROC3]|uniref:hypothetical protein n=1 Tax=Microcoleus sp. BROC3 TaxID=3055323 RepID=UPI002FD61A4B
TRKFSIVEQARCLFLMAATGKMPVPQENSRLWNRQDACSSWPQQARCLFHKKILDCGTGKMPVPHGRNRQDACSTLILWNRHLACSSWPRFVRSHLTQHQYIIVKIA